tara:strand:+ start:12398 stop:12559 length:162 start_codon:yes stop_codon:yes gene_type:complete
MANTWEDHWDGDNRIGPRLSHGGFTEKEEKALLTKHMWEHYRKLMEDKQNGSK